jgi:hypothetical protein
MNTRAEITIALTLTALSLSQEMCIFANNSTMSYGLATRIPSNLGLLLLLPFLLPFGSEKGTISAASKDIATYRNRPNKSMLVLAILTNSSD